MAVNTGRPCVWEVTETDVMVSQEDTHSPRQSVHITEPGLKSHGSGLYIVGGLRQWEVCLG